MKPSSRTPEGDDNHCQICGHRIRIEPTRPPGDATCPYCGVLLWFDAEEVSTGDIAAARQWRRVQQAIQQNDMRYAERLLRMAITMDPSNAQFQKTFEEVKVRRRTAARNRGRRRRQRT